MEHLIGKKVIAFEFSGGPGFNVAMGKLIGQEGTIEQCYANESSCRVMFNSGQQWSYPYPEILDHLVENSKSIEDILIEMKQLTSQIWKTKI